jgi:integrase/recombinase XerD
MIKDYSINVMLDKRRPKVNGNFPVRLWVYNSSTKTSKRYPTNFNFTESEFQSIWETVKTRNEYKAIKRDLQDLIDEAEKVAEKLKPFTFEAFEKKIYSDAEAGANVIWQFEQTIKELTVAKRIGTITTYKQSINSLKEFAKYETGKDPKKLTFSEITPKWLERYENYMKNIKGRSITTVGIYLRTLRAVFNTAKLQKEIEPETYPFGKGKYKIPAVKSVKKALHKDKLKQLFEAQPKTPEQEKAKDFWFFSYSCNGMNIKDIAQLRYENIQGGEIIFYRAKTINTSKENLKPVRVYLTEYAKEIINKYGNKKTSPKQLVFSIIEGNESDLTQYHKIKNFTRFINQNLKKLAVTNGITAEISTYWARHSFATNAIRNGASMEFVSEALSHSDIKTTKGYFAGFADETKKEFAETLMNF